MRILLAWRHLLLLLPQVVVVVVVVVVVAVAIVVIVVKSWPELVNNKSEATTSKYKFGARAGKHNLGARASKYKLGTRAGRHKSGARVVKWKLGTRARSWYWGPGKRLKARKYKYTVTATLYFIVSKHLLKTS